MSLLTDQKYVGMLSLKLARFTRKGDSLYNFRCPFCGDSQKSKIKARAFLYSNKDRLSFKCHNCGLTTSMAKLVEQVDPNMYREYCLETFGDRNKKTANAETFFISKKETAPAKKDSIKELLPSLASLPKFHEAVSYARARLLPQERYDDLFYAEDMSVLEKLNVAYEKKLPKDKRIIIPFRNKAGELTGVTGRAIETTKLRYATMRLADEPLMYGLDRVKTENTIYVVEGQIDSMFIDNAVAPGGTDFQRALYYIPKEKTVLVFDNQPRNKDVVKIVEKMCYYKHTIVIWPSNWKYKDINEAITAGVSRQEIMGILKRHTYKDLALKLAIRDWKK